MVFYLKGKKIFSFRNILRGVAQFGSASGLGPEGRGFKSCHPDQLNNFRVGFFDGFWDFNLFYFIQYVDLKYLKSVLAEDFYFLGCVSRKNANERI